MSEQCSVSARKCRSLCRTRSSAARRSVTSPTVPTAPTTTPAASRRGAERPCTCRTLPSRCTTRYSRWYSRAAASASDQPATSASRSSGWTRSIHPGPSTSASVASHSSSARAFAYVTRPPVSAWKTPAGLDAQSARNRSSLSRSAAAASPATPATWAGAAHADGASSPGRGGGR